MDSILKKAYSKVVDDEKFVKLTFFSLLPYSLLFVAYLFYQAYFVITSLKWGVHWNELKLYIENVFAFWEHNLILFVLIIAFILVAYFFIPPIAESALIFYLSENKSVGSSVWKWFLKFFPMFELHWFLSLFSFLFFFIVVSRLYVLDMLNPTFVLPLIIIWLIFIIFFNLTSVYAKFLVVLENYSPFDAIKESIKLTFVNFGITLKWFLMYVFLYIRFILNILFLIWIPLFVAYLFLKSNVSNVLVVKYTVYSVMFMLFLITAYINSIIEAFFVAMWYEVFKKIEKN